MKAKTRGSLNVSFVLFTLIFAIAFVSTFTYLSFHLKSVEQAEQDIYKYLEMQAVYLKKELNPVEQAKTEYSAGVAQKKAFAEISEAWKKLNLKARNESVHLVYKSPKTNIQSVALSSDNTLLQSADPPLIRTSWLKRPNRPNIHIKYFDDHVLFTGYKAITTDRWGLVVLKKLNFIDRSLYETLSYTLFSALLITMISWLVLRIMSRAKHTQDSIDERYQELLKNTRDWVWEIDNHGRFTYSSEEIQDLIGLSASEILSFRFEEFFDPKSSYESKLIWKQKIMLKEAFTNLEISIKTRTGKIKHLLINGYPVFNTNNSEVYFRGMARDISEIKNREELLINQAYFDPLTELLNRQQFIDKLAKIVENQDHKTLSPTALLFIDLDGFKKVNDGLGHDFGDAVLKAVAQRIKSHSRKDDLLGRFGGDEFVFLFRCTKMMPRKDFIERLEGFLRRLITHISEPVEIENKMVQIGASIGVGLIPQDGKTVTELINHADIAMYHAKSRGKNTYEFYNTGAQQEADKKLKTSAEVELAIEQGQLELYYQFQFTDNKIVAMEALLRWHHPQSRKTLCAGEFIPSIKDSHQTQLIDKWVINRVSEDIKQLKQSLFEVPQVSINLSTQEMLESSLPAIVQDAIKRNFINGYAFNIEVSENILAENFQQASRIVKKLSEMGVETVIDHFGTGYLSLTNLHRLPIKTIKIDRNFIKDIATNNSDLQICRTIIKLSKTMGLEVVAEGVETSIQQEILQREGCDIMQGFIYSQPMPLDKVISFIQEHPLKILKKDKHG